MEEKEGDASEVAFLRAQLRHETLSKIEALEEQGFYDDADFYYLVKNFFKQYLKLDYECTVNELSTELKKIYLSEPVRAQLDQILDHIGLVEYLSERPQNNETQKHLLAFKLIVEDLLTKTNTSSITYFWQKFGMQELFQLLKGHRAIPKSENQQSIESILVQLKKNLQDRNFESARTLYQQIMELYNHLQEQDKAKYYQQIHELYGALSTAT